MLNTIWWFVRLGLEVAAVLFGIWIFFYICRNGIGAPKELIRTLAIAVKAWCRRLREKLEEEEHVEEKKTKETWLINGKEFDSLDKAEAEINRCLINHETLTL